MFRRIWSHLRPAVFWSYRRGGWQYDIIVALILAFIFLTPRSLFNDRPSAAVVHEVERPPDGTRVFWVEPGAVDRASPEAVAESLQSLLRSRSGENLRVLKAEPARDDSGNVRAYLVYAQP